MGWLLPAVVATLCGTLALTFIYLYLYLKDKEKSIGIWTLSWSFSALRYLLVLFIIKFGDNSYLLIGNQICSLISGILLLIGCYIWVNKKIHKLWYLITILTVIWIIFATIKHLPFLWLTVPTFTIIGCINIWTGIFFLKNIQLKGGGKYIIGITFIIWGLHKLDYPFLRPVIWFAPWGYLLSSICSLLASMGIVLVYFERAREELKKSEEKFRQLAENIPEVFWIGSPDWEKIYYISPAYEKHWEKSPDSLYKNPLSWLENILDEDKPGIIKAIENIDWEDNVIVFPEYRIKREDGSIRWIFARAFPVYDKNGKVLRVTGIAEDITDQKQYEQDLYESHESYRCLIENIGDIILRYDKSIRPIYVSPNISEIKDLALNEIIGKYHYEMGFPKELCTLWDYHINEVFKTGQHYDGEFETEGTEGKLIFNWRLFPEYDSNGKITTVLSLCRDITARKVSEDNYTTLFSKMLDAFAQYEIIYNDDGTPVDYVFLSVNPSFEKMTGLKASDIIGKRVKEVFPNAEDFWINAYANVALTGEPAHFEHYSKELNKYFELSVYRSAPKQFAVIFRDITERKMAEEQQQAISEQIQHTQKLESLGVLAGGIAHDFNNLLMSILGNADLALLEMSKASPARDNIAEIETAARRAAELTRQLLAYSGKGRFVVEPVNLTEVVEEMTHILEVSISKKAMLRFNFDKHIPAIIADAAQIRQIIMNLITNASDAIADKSGMISISTGVMNCDEEYLKSSYLRDKLPEGEYVFIEVSDTGSGMDKETQHKIFDPFFTTKFTGRGLGMAAVLGIIRGHKGAIKLYSEVGKGSSFKVLFPSSGENSKQIVQEENKNHICINTGKILLVDDENNVRRIAKKMLNKAGFEVILANDGQEGVNLFKENKNDIDCVILDLTMPHMDGEEAFREIKRIDDNMKVLLSSGYSEQEVVTRFTGKGLSGFIQKPYMYSSLIDTLKSILED